MAMNIVNNCWTRNFYLASRNFREKKTDLASWYVKRGKIQAFTNNMNAVSCNCRDKEVLRRFLLINN